MKIKFLFALCIAFGMMSCTQQSIETTSQRTAPVSFTLKDRGAASVKSSTESPIEKKINDFQIFVFNSDGTLDVSGYKNGSGELTLKCSVGNEKSIFALANHRKDITGQIAHEDDLKEIVSYLYDNSLNGGMVMSGRVKMELIGAGEPVEITVDRMVSKVRIDKITNNLSPALGSLTINGIYCVNVCGDAPIIPDSSYQPQQWFNKCKYVEEANNSVVNAMISETGINAVLANKVAHNAAHFFYVYPNGCTVDSSAESFSPRYTRLVIDTTVENDADRAGKKVTNRYYAIDLVVREQDGTITPLDRNKLYHITGLDIHRLGSLSPDQPVVLESFRYKISVNDWETGFDKDVEI